MPKPKGQEDPGRTVHEERVMRVAGLSRDRLRKLARDGYFRPPNDGLYGVDDVFAGLIRHYREMGARNRTEVAELAKKRGAVADEDAALKREKRLKLAGKLVEKSKALLVWQSHVVAVRQRLEQSALPKKERDSILRELAAGAEEYE